MDPRTISCLYEPLGEKRKHAGEREKVEKRKGGKGRRRTKEARWSSFGVEQIGPN